MSPKSDRQRTAAFAARMRSKGFKRVAVWIPTALEDRFRSYVEKLKQEFERTKK